MKTYRLYGMALWMTLLLMAGPLGAQATGGAKALAQDSVAGQKDVPALKRMDGRPGGDTLTRAVADTLARMVTDTLLRVNGRPEAQAVADTLTGIQTDTLARAKALTLADTLRACTADTLRADTLSRNPRPQARPTLPAWMKPYFVLKLKRGPQGRGYRLDTVSLAYERHLAVLDYLNDPATPERYLTIDPQYARLFLPLTYYERPISRYSRLNWHFTGVADSLRARTHIGLRLDTAFLAQREDTRRQVDGALLAAYLTRMDKVRYTAREIAREPAYRDNLAREEKSRPSVLKLFQSEKMKYVRPADEAEVIIHKPNWWVTGGTGSLSFAQNHISDNWYNGGESTHSLLGNLQLYANYNDREKWQWENLIDAKLGFISAPSDQYHKYLVNNDQLRLASKLGLQAVKNWYYTLTTEFKTQFCNGYGANSQTLSAAFLSPADWTTGVGMDYKLGKPLVTLSVQMLPLTYTMKIVTNPEMDETALGLKEGDKTKHDFGSQVKANLTWNPWSFVSVTSRFDYLTSYHTVRIEWENTFKFILNRFLSAQLYVYARYDDGVAPAENGTYFQINENFGFGLNYTW